MQKTYALAAEEPLPIHEKKRLRTSMRRPFGMISKKKTLDIHIGSPFDHEYRVISRVKRFGITSESIWNHYIMEEPCHANKLDFVRTMEKLDKDPVLIMLTSLYVYLIDQLSWGNYKPKEAIQECNSILERIKDTFSTDCIYCTENQNPEVAMKNIITTFEKTLVTLIRKANQIMEEYR